MEVSNAHTYKHRGSACIPPSVRINTHICIYMNTKTLCDSTIEQQLRCFSCGDYAFLSMSLICRVSSNVTRAVAVAAPTAAAGATAAACYVKQQQNL